MEHDTIMRIHNINHLWTHPDIRSFYLERQRRHTTPYNGSNALQGLRCALQSSGWSSSCQLNTALKTQKRTGIRLFAQKITRLNV